MPARSRRHLAALILLAAAVMVGLVLVTALGWRAYRARRLARLADQAKTLKADGETVLAAWQAGRAAGPTTAQTARRSAARRALEDAKDVYEELFDMVSTADATGLMLPNEGYEWVEMELMGINSMLHDLAKGP